MADEKDKTTKPRRRWFQFSLRTFLVVILLVGASLGWLGAKMEHARRRQLAVSELQELGWHFASMSPNRSTWALSLFGDDSVSNMDAAWTIHAAVDERALSHFAVLNHLRRITFVTAVPYAKVKKLQQVLPHCTINVEAWDQLPRLPLRVE